MVHHSDCALALNNNTKHHSDCALALNNNTKHNQTMEYKFNLEKLIFGITLERIVDVQTPFRWEALHGLDNNVAELLKKWVVLICEWDPFNE